MRPRDQAIVNALLDAYAQGYFPMAESREGGRVLWLNPDRRGVIPIEGFHVPRRLRDRVRSGRFRVTSDAAFDRVIHACAEPRPSEEDTWIDGRIVDAYIALHRAGHAHSVEVWLDPPPGGSAGPALVGGLYGVRLGGAFFAESKFSRPALGGTDASKVALVYLCAHLRARGFALLDVQFYTEHLSQFGCVEIPRAEYLPRLERAVAMDAAWGTFDSAAIGREISSSGRRPG